MPERAAVTLDKANMQRNEASPSAASRFNGRRNHDVVDYKTWSGSATIISEPVKKKHPESLQFVRTAIHSPVRQITCRGIIGIFGPTFTQPPNFSEPLHA